MAKRAPKAAFRAAEESTMKRVEVHGFCRIARVTPVHYLTQTASPFARRDRSLSARLARVGSLRFG